jgi:hypothetical protein
LSIIAQAGAKVSFKQAIYSSYLIIITRPSFRGAGSWIGRAGYPTTMLPKISSSSFNPRGSR